MPAKTDIQKHLKILGSGLRGKGVRGGFETFYETIRFVKTFLTLPQFYPVSHTRQVYKWSLSYHSCRLLTLLELLKMRLNLNQEYHLDPMATNTEGRKYDQTVHIPRIHNYRNLEIIASSKPLRPTTDYFGLNDPCQSHHQHSHN